MKQISQAYFDETVRNNMELFDLSIDDAIREAVESFTLEKVDLSNIVKDMVKYTDGHPGIICLNSMKTLKCSLPDTTNDVISELKSLKSISSADFAVRKLLAQSGVAEEILYLLEVFSSERSFDAFIISAKTLKTIMKGQPDILSDAHLKSLIDILTKFLENVSHCKADTIEYESLSSLYSVLRTSCVNNEPSRNILSRSKIIIQSLSLLVKISDHNDSDKFIEFIPVIREVCRFFQTLTQDDDIRVTFGEGSNNARTIAESELALDTFVNLTKGALKWSAKEIISELLFTLSAITTREEFCAKLASLGGIDLILQIIYTNLNNREIISASLVLLKALCGSDSCKRTIGSWHCELDCSSGDQETQPKLSGPTLIMEVFEHYISNTTVVKQAAAVIAALVLRQPDLAEYVVQASAPELLTKALELHSKSPATIRAICMAIRNCVSRSPELRTMFVGSSSANPNATSQSELDPLGLETLLNDALKIPECYDEAKAALRDLGCKVELKELWRGTQSGITN